MSTLLKEAIVDAKALRDAALKNAETSIIEKYSDEVRQTLDSLLEQDELDLGLGAEGEEDISAVDPMAMEEGERVRRPVEPFRACAAPERVRRRGGGWGGR